jgi:POT family proton-dependent oligopeptide transporter
MRQRHPIGLYILFFTEMWERFGFYCLEAVFVYYMKVSRYEFLRENSSRIYGWYLAGVYFSPLVGGWLAEWRFGYTLSIVLGGLSMAAGYGLLSQEPAVCFAVGLGMVIIGNGLFKPNISSLLGKLYPPGDKRIDAAFTIFYMGINVGALMAPIIAAIVGNLMAAAHGPGESMERQGYLIVFTIAAGGMLVGEAIYLTFGRFARPIRDAETATADVSDVPADLQRKRNLALAIFFGINVLFWMAFKQRGNSMALWTKDRMDLSAPGWLADLFAALHVDWLMLKDGQFGKEFFLTLNPFFVIVLSPLLVWFWSALRAARLEVPTPAKLVLGFLFTAGAFAIMWRCETVTRPDQRASSRVLVAFYVALTLGELCLSPMGLSLVSKLAAARTRSVWMGLFFVSTSAGGWLAGEVYQRCKSVPYGEFFLGVCIALLGGTVLMFAAYPVIASALRSPPATAKV